jgi:hypothetical protein
MRDLQLHAAESFPSAKREGEGIGCDTANDAAPPAGIRCDAPDNATPGVDDPASDARLASGQITRSEQTSFRTIEETEFAHLATDPSQDKPRPPQDHAQSVWGARTGFAGLLFLVPILERLGFPGFLEANRVLAESDFARRLLLFVGARVGMKREDPMARALGQVESIEFAAVPELPATARALLAFHPPRARIDTLELAWLTVMRRWSRRQARIGLASLICRSGRVRPSLTHLNIGFDLAEADLRVRRMALDVDPGWVGWLGRVVSFQYLESNDD